MGTQFIANGLARGERAVLAIFEEHPADYLARAKSLGFDLAPELQSGRLRLVHLRPLDLSSEEVLFQLEQAVAELGATRLVVDSLNGVELALAPTYRDDFREALYRLTGRLTGRNVSVIFVIEVMESFQDIRFSPHAISFLTQNILFLRYIEIAGHLRKMIVVIKMRRSHHSTEMHEIELTSRGMRILGPLTEYEGVLRGTPMLRPPERTRTPGLTDAETAVFELLMRSGEATFEELVVATGRSAAEVASMLGRLVALNYAIEVVEENRTLYRLAERPLGAR
jgi:circadian clock protein KaiC